MKVHLTTTSRCIQCDWTAQGPTADREATKHVKDTGHAVGTRSVPAGDDEEER